MEKELDFLSHTKKMFHLGETNPSSYSSLSLAFIGDGVYELIIRTVIVAKYNTAVSRINKMTSDLAKAASQAQIARQIMDELTQEELGVYKRGRNAKSVTMAKNATVADYRMATGLEALVGYLYLSGQFERMMYLVKTGIEKFTNNKKRD
ncbi:Mini-ribonuclease 3 [Parasporobacterium paucivorans]|uniref:Mini-ribonuclease 3 n=1 Tax=Parasporobacterium paucivorans DSM 15970 TaxID=1122934 RepID=A0A1M6FQY6_9FIRM|nr:ribonuclease III domain-containing protein [Parasporobacterium paucivorans]SHJ00065.1 ribonuclease-3 family protein [Parasporobacterium paucivorans DSM 15970]